MASRVEAITPLILTLGMDDISQERFDRLRGAHFPPERNLVPAHLTLFHHLPGERKREIVAAIEKVCRDQRQTILTATGLVFLGRGVAYALESPGLETVRRRLAEEWWPWLGDQDRRGFRPHVTVQNKAPAREARATYERLEATFSPFEVVAEGLSLWRYLGGPWRSVGTYPFRG